MLALLSLLALSAGPVAAEEDGPKIRVGDPMPRFELFDMEDQQIRSADITEPVIVLNFWAFWCDTWIAQLPQLRELAAEQKRLNFRLIAVSIDGQWTDQLRQVCGDEGVPFSVLVDRDRRLTDKLGLRRIPTVMVIDRQHRVTYLHESYPGNPPVLEAIRKAASRAAEDAPEE